MKNNKNLFYLGLGFGLGTTVIWLIFELWPVIVFSIFSYIMFIIFKLKE